MMNRRRALMTQGENSITLKDLQTASVFRTSGTSTFNYIYLGIINGTAWLLMEQVISTASKMRNDALCDYEGSLIDNYLTNTWQPSFSEHAKEYMENTTVTFPASDGTNVVNKTITRKAFLPTLAQLKDNANGILSVLKKYHNTTSANTARQAKDSGGTYRGYWTCSAVSTTSMSSIGATGTNGNFTPNTPSGTIYRRPIVSFSKDTPVRLVDGAYILA